VVSWNLNVALTTDSSRFLNNTFDARTAPKNWKMAEIVCKRALPKQMAAKIPT
jgi:hypothetical protein